MTYTVAGSNAQSAPAATANLTGGPIPKPPDCAKHVNKGETCCAAGCKRPATRKGLCAMHYGRLRSNGDFEKRKRKGAPLLALFYERYRPGLPDECWPWNGAYGTKGYGRLTIRGTKVRECAAHRLSYEIHNGPIDPELLVRHKCDNPACVNPAHLVVGTYADNSDDMTSRGRQARGEQAGNTKLTCGIIDNIRQLYAQGELTQKQIGKLYGVAQSTISSIVLRKTWDSPASTN